MNMIFKDIDVGGYVFGQMTATGYKKVVSLDHDDPDHGWSTGDLILYDMSNDPCFRIVPLRKGIRMTKTGKGKIKTFKKA